MNTEKHEQLLVDATDTLKKLGHYNSNFLLILVGILLNITFFTVGGYGVFPMLSFMVLLFVLFIVCEMNFSTTDEKLKKILNQLNTEEE